MPNPEPTDDPAYEPAAFYWLVSDNGTPIASFIDESDAKAYSLSLKLATYVPKCVYGKRRIKV